MPILANVIIKLVSALVVKQLDLDVDAVIVSVYAFDLTLLRGGKLNIEDVIRVITRDNGVIVNSYVFFTVVFNSFVVLADAQRGF